MSAQAPLTRITAPQIMAMKGGTPIVALTAYSAPMARMVDAHADVILVGDSLGMVVHGLPSTVGVTMEMMILHGQAVMRGSARAMVVVDMPFGSYEEGPEQAFRNATRILMETGCGAVKLEGGARMAPTIRFLTERGVPVMGHVGLTPQSTLTMGGFRTQGRDQDTWPAHVADARAVADAGAFSIVAEGVMEGLADRMTEAVPVPVIGIGASARCDGQILVVDDMLGLTERVPRFVRKFGDLGPRADRAIADYAAAVRDRSFPEAAQVYR
ncbi:3-methyl-2-oxobutanoate hydroxymethyltransferase [Paracoccus sp. 1_MG-2023]|uniref:3-methyl-2-oxobutanoate hydroxymethyltransferase n=1 Tax=unclassified Paracoccus (in: a-proteobacteria) TaxID=2688777 RepID=UPI001C08ED9C|nr:MULTISPECIES: 3-methyl-2-oxobutanoate hydroxymethyltransferase [unclassified Paracoccus (in: a-proteobacteria)]MBU2958204.1 3-methyl-2-oxobutanoate hydroxymethyltransferase [Paracoccus sp. C2R09]MDO6668331.1 3-methyl-2-oxobutanoate hydroxymethyltransferase [Paracoccus sp. 1_MG-2023]